MARVEKTVFISYRRTDVYTALAVYENLKNQRYDVFFDYRSISSGDFEQIITSNIRARAHFLLILTPTALDRCNEPGDWLRREIEFAIEEKRNIIPLFFRGFRFGVPSVTEKLTGRLKHLSRYNGLNIHEDYFDEAMRRLSTQYLSIPLETILHPVSTEVQKVVEEEQVAADKALEQIVDAKGLVKQADEGSAAIRAPQKPIAAQPGKDTTSSRGLTNAKSWRLIAGSAIGLAVIAFWVVGGLLISSALLSNASDPPATPSLRSSATLQEEVGPTSGTESAAEPVGTASLLPEATRAAQLQATRDSLLDTVLENLATNRADETIGKDGMTLLYVHAGEFTMGSDDGKEDERPAHIVYLDAFWIDQHEVTNAQYIQCVDTETCPPRTTDNWSSYTRDSYYRNSEFDDFPVVFVSRYEAEAYCQWADRRLPTEAEWEKAARGTDGRAYPWGNNPPNDSLLNYNNAVGDTTAVGQYLEGASPYGAFDMAGNVWEWVADGYDSKFYSNSPYANPMSPPSDVYNVLRGGSWVDTRDVLTTVRLSDLLGRGNYYTGFRCAMDATP